jgi:hypothetical protein
VVRFCEHGNEPSSSIREVKCFDLLSNQFFANDCAIQLVANTVISLLGQKIV